MIDGSLELVVNFVVVLVVDGDWVVAEKFRLEVVWLVDCLVLKLVVVGFVNGVVWEVVWGVGLQLHSGIPFETSHCQKVLKLIRQKNSQTVKWSSFDWSQMIVNWPEPRKSSTSFKMSSKHLVQAMFVSWMQLLQLCLPRQPSLMHSLRVDLQSSSRQVVSHVFCSSFEIILFSTWFFRKVAKSNQKISK